MVEESRLSSGHAIATRRVGSLAWGLLTIVAVCWPGRIISPLDGLPFDGKAEAMLLGMILPILWWLHPAFLRKGWVRAVVASLAVWKLGTWLLVSQGGWCVQLRTEDPIVRGGPRVQQSWDVRSDWHRPIPRCSAILTRPLWSLHDFPVWFVNLLDDRTQGFLNPVEGRRRPPAGRFGMTLEGYLTTSHPGIVAFLLNDGVNLSGSVDGVALSNERLRELSLPLDAGTHHLRLELALSGGEWRFVPTWNGRVLWASALTTVTAPTTLDRFLWSGGRFVTPLLLVWLIAGWLASAVKAFRPTPAVAAWVIGACAALGGLGWASRAIQVPEPAIRAAPLLLLGVLAIPVAKRLQHVRGVFWLLGLPWISFFLASSAPEIGRFTLYSLGDDWLTFQMFAHRIFMQGFWLEGGQQTFWYQPLYRWMVGVLHLIFGDSSVGEVYWDCIGLVISALFSVHVVKRCSGFRYGLLAGVVSLATFTLSPTWYLIGRGLSEISAAAWAYLAAFAMLRARLGCWRPALLAGLFATLAFYTRLNHLPFLLALLALLSPLAHQTDRREGWLATVGRMPRRVVWLYGACLGVGMLLLALRTWYYTGVFSLLYGTQRDLLSTGLGWSTLGSLPVWKRALESLLMVVTIQDPPRFDPRSLVVTFGVLCAVLTVLRVAGFRRLARGPSLVCLSALVFSLLVRGSGYPGRFSVHLIPMATGMCVMTLAAAWRGIRLVRASS